MVNIKLALLSVLLVTHLTSFTSCQDTSTQISSSSNVTDVGSFTSKQNVTTDLAKDVEDESDSDSESETENEDESENGKEKEDEDESDSESENEDEAESESSSDSPKESEDDETEEKLKDTPRSDEVVTKGSEANKTAEVDLEDDVIAEPRCKSRYSNLNCTEVQRQQAIAAYKASRSQLVKDLFNPSSNVSTPIRPVNNVSIPTVPPTFGANDTSNNATQSSSQSTVSISSPTNGTSIATPTSPSIASNIRSCNRATQLLTTVDQYLRFDQSCNARAFGRRNNPDFWIERCRKALKRHH